MRSARLRPSSSVTTSATCHPAASAARRAASRRALARRRRSPTGRGAARRGTRCGWRPSEVVEVVRQPRIGAGTKLVDERAPQLGRTPCGRLRGVGDETPPATDAADDADLGPGGADIEEKGEIGADGRRRHAEAQPVAEEEPDAVDEQEEAREEEEAQPSADTGQEEPARRSWPLPRGGGPGARRGRSRRGRGR